MQTDYKTASTPRKQNTNLLVYAAPTSNVTMSSPAAPRCHFLHPVTCLKHVGLWGNPHTSTVESCCTKMSFFYTPCTATCLKHVALGQPTHQQCQVLLHQNVIFLHHVHCHLPQAGGSGATHTPAMSSPAMSSHAAPKCHFGTPRALPPASSRWLWGNPYTSNVLLPQRQVLLPQSGQLHHHALQQHCLVWAHNPPALLHR
jgi:hypothetical protein